MHRIFDKLYELNEFKQANDVSDLEINNELVINSLKELINITKISVADLEIALNYIKNTTPGESVKFQSNIDMDQNLITNLPDGLSPLDAVNVSQCVLRVGSNNMLGDFDMNNHSIINGADINAVNLYSGNLEALSGNLSISQHPNQNIQIGQLPVLEPSGTGHIYITPASDKYSVINKPYFVSDILCDYSRIQNIAPGINSNDVPRMDQVMLLDGSRNMVADIQMSNHNIYGLAPSLAADSACRYDKVMSLVCSYAMENNLNMGNFQIQNMLAGSNSAHGCTVGQVLLLNGSNSMSGNLNMNSYALSNVSQISAYNNLIQIGPNSSSNILIGSSPSLGVQSKLHIVNENNSVNSFQVDDMQSDSTIFVCDAAGSVGVGITQASPINQYAKFEIRTYSSEAKCFLLPRLPTVNIPNPSNVEGLLIWDSSLHVMKVFDGTSWKTVTMV